MPELESFIDALDNVGGSATERTGNGDSGDGNDSRGDSGNDDRFAGFETIDPESVPGNAADAGSGTRKRRADAGQRRGPRGPNKARSGDSVTGIESLLLSLHGIAASIFEAESIALKSEEANKLAGAIMNVSRHYDHKIDPKTMAWLNLAMVAGTIYGGRVVKHWMQPEKEKAAPNRVVNIKPETNGKVRDGVVEKATVVSDLFGLNTGAALSDAG